MTELSTDPAEGRGTAPGVFGEFVSNLKVSLIFAHPTLRDFANALTGEKRENRRSL
jgi:hypothetical protein